GVLPAPSPLSSPDAAPPMVRPPPGAAPPAVSAATPAEAQVIKGVAVGLGAAVVSGGWRAELLVGAKWGRWVFGAAFDLAEVGSRWAYAAGANRSSSASDV